MQNSFQKVLGILLFVFLLSMTVISVGAAEEATEQPYMQDYYDGTVLDLTQYEGKVVFINYFTEWCPYCMAEMPDIKTAYDTYDPEALEIILVHPWDGENADNSASVVATYGLEGVTVIEDEDFALTTAIGVPGYPTSVIVDQDGYLYYAVASKIDIDLLTAAFDDLGVSVREDVTAEATPTPVPAASAIDTTTGATPKR